jgi:hypothetical protein
MRRLALATIVLLAFGAALAQANDFVIASVINEVLDDVTLTRIPCSAGLIHRGFVVCAEYPYSDTVFVGHELRGAQDLFLTRMRGRDATTTWVSVNALHS